MAPRLMPDLLTLVIDYLTGVIDLTATFGDPPRLGSKVDVTKTAVLPAGRLTHVSTVTPVRRHLDGINIQCEVWADTELEAFDAANLLRAILLDDDPVDGLIGYRIAGYREGTITGTVDSLALQQLHDPDVPTLARYVFGVRVYGHP